MSDWKTGAFKRRVVRETSVFQHRGELSPSDHHSLHPLKPVGPSQRYRTEEFKIIGPPICRDTVVSQTEM